MVQVDFSGFQAAVNALGGIYLDFPYPAKDSYSGLDITTPGCQLLNGTQALAVARARHYEYYSDGYWQYDPTSDFGRIDRQDVFLRALIAEAKSKVNPLTVNAFIGSIHEGITIDDGFGFNELVGLALRLPLVRPGRAADADAAHGHDGNDFGDLGDVLTVDQPAAQQTLVNIFGSSLIAPTNPPPGADGVTRRRHRSRQATAPTPSPSSSSSGSTVPPRRPPPRPPSRRRSTRSPAPRADARDLAAASACAACRVEVGASPYRSTGSE